MARTSSQLVVDFLVKTSGLQTGFRRATRETDRFGRSIGQSSRSTDRMGSTLRRATLAAAGTAAAFVPLSLAISQAARSTIEFDRSMRNVNSIAQLGEGQFQGLSKSVLELAGPTAQAPRTLADGLYDLVSSGFQSREALQVLEVSAKAATAGLTTTEVASKTVAAALNAYRLPAKRASVISDVLFRTVDRGVISFEQLSSDIGDVLPFASSLGVGLEEVGASIATMTKAGIGSAETMTRVKNVMVTLLKPGDDLSAAMKSVGYESGEAMIQSLGFQGTLDALIKTTDGSKNAVAQLFPNIRALGGALALTGQNSAQASEDLAGMREAAGATDRALSQQSESIYFQWQRLKATAEALAIEFGSSLVPSIRDVLKVLSDDSLTIGERFSEVRKRVIEAIQEIAPQAAEAAGEVGVIIATSMGRAFMETGLLGKLAIGSVFVRMFGGPAAIVAAGAQVGTLFSKGRALAMTNVYAYQNARQAGFSRMSILGQALGSSAAAGFARGAMRFGMIGAGIAIADQLLQSVSNRIQRGSSDVFEALDAIANKPFLEDKLNTIIKGIDLTFTGSADMSESNAQFVMNALREIGNADRERFTYLERNIQQRVRELKLSDDLKKKIQEIIDTSRVGQQNVSDDRLNAMNRTIASGAFIGGDLERAVEQQLSRINDTYGRYTRNWRNAVDATFRAQIDATRRNYSEAGRLTEEGQRRIQEIIRRRARLIATGDPTGIAKGILNGWRRAGKVNDAGIRSFIGRLAKMPPAARKQAGATMIAYARELEQKGKLPDGTVKRLRSKILLRFDGLWPAIRRATSQGWKGVDQGFEKGTSDADKKMDRLERKTKEHAATVRKNISSIPGPVRTAYSRLAGYANETARAFGSNQQVRLSFRGGGKVPGRNLVPAAVSPGELISHKGREIYVPGRPEPRDSVLMFLPVGAKVFTRDGQMRLAAGASESEALRKQAPHFAAGGMVGSDLPRPRLSGGAQVPRATGQAAIDRGRTQAKAYIERLKPTLAGLERLASKFGLRTSSGYRAGDDGYHGINRARDFSNSSGPTPEMLRFAKYVGGNFGRHLLELIYSPLGWSIKNGVRTAPYAVADHYDHVHVALRKGGKVRNINRIYPESNSAYGNWGGPTLPSYVVAALAQAAGMPGKTMEQVTRGESGAHRKNSARPGATGIDPGGTKGHGLWMITTTFADDLAAKAGGWRNMLNPVVNAWAAAQIYRRQGLRAWYGTGSVTGDGLNYSGKFDIRNALGGLSFQGALYRATNGRLGTKPKSIPKIKKGARGLDNRIDRLRENANPRGRKLLNRADKLVARAMAAADRGDVAKARDLIKRARAIVARASKMTGGGNRPGETPAAGSGNKVGGRVGYLLDLARQARGDTKESLLSSALSVAQETEGIDDDRAVLNRQRIFQEGRLRNARQKLRQANRKLKQKGLSKKERRKWQEQRRRALETLGIATAEISSIDSQLDDLGADGGTGDSAADLVEAMKELAEAIQEQNRLQSSVQATSSREALRMLSDVISGQIVGKRTPVGQTPVGVRY